MFSGVYLLGFVAIGYGCWVRLLSFVIPYVFGFRLPGLFSFVFDGFSWIEFLILVRCVRI